VDQKVSHRIDVLGYNGFQAAGLEEPGQGQVTGVWLRVPHLGVAVDLAPPVLPAGLGVGQELGQLDGTHALPDAPGAAEIRYAALGGDAGAGEDHQIAAGTHPSGELGDLSFKLHIHATITIPD
jgi:hypothetical protein